MAVQTDLKAVDFITRWHSFANDVKEDAKVITVGHGVRSITHVCSKDTEKLRRSLNVGPGFFGLDESVAGTQVKLEKPIELAPRSGYCKHCNILWVADE